MGNVHATITLKNVGDIRYAHDGYIKEEDIRSVTVNALVDTGAMTICITEEIRQKLGLEIVETRFARIANGERVTCQITEPVEILWKNRHTTCKSVVIPGAQIILLGVIPLEDMDLTVNPVGQELVGANGDEWLTMAVGLREF
ncbi:MAG: clan AA aspartic protease [Treponema sp.]|nr:clan AA aspartic protease [Treponema sp.]